jgi:methylase of polypeptide subunit release factors
LSIALAAKQRATRSPLLLRWLFGVRAGALEPGDRYFDLTTLALRRAARARVRRGSRVLDMGTGTSAVLGLWLHRALGCRVVCTDVSSLAVARAREVVAHNGADVEVRCTPFFDGLEQEFDYVFFNPPYLPTAVGIARRQPEALRSMWDGGADGTRAIAAFLAAFAAWDARATAVLGVNRLHVPRARVEELLGAEAGVAPIAIDAHPLLPVDVYFLERTKSPSTSTSMPQA